MLPFSEGEYVYETLAVRTVAVFLDALVQLSAKSLHLFLTEGNDGIAACIVTRLLQDGLRALDLRTWAQREATAKPFFGENSRRLAASGEAQTAT